MQCAYNVSTSVGDRRILYKPSAIKYALIKATKEDVGFIELMFGTRKQVEEELEVYERNKEQSAGLDSSETTSVGWANTFELQQRDEGWYTGNVRNSKGRERVDDIYGGRVSKELVDGTESASEIRGNSNERLEPKANKRDTHYSTTNYANTFYSYMARVIDGIKQTKLGADSVVNMLRGKGVKAEEIKWSGIESWLEGKKSATKEELLEFVAGIILSLNTLQKLTELPHYR